MAMIESRRISKAFIRGLDIAQELSEMAKNQSEISENQLEVTFMSVLCEVSLGIKYDLPAHPATGTWPDFRTSVYKAEFAPGTREGRRSPSGPLAQSAAIRSKKANANHVPNTNPEITS